MLGIILLYCVIIFFFSSRRRHTRYWRDWSSDVCSSDLSTPASSPKLCSEISSMFETLGERLNTALDGVRGSGNLTEDQRSEERRVGKECRSRWSPYH